MWAESCKQSCSLLLYCLVVNCETRTLYNTLKPRWRQYDDSQHNGWTRSQFVWLCIDLSLFSTIKSKITDFLQELDFVWGLGLWRISRQSATNRKDSNPVNSRTTQRAGSTSQGQKAERRHTWTHDISPICNVFFLLQKYSFLCVHVNLILPYGGKSFRLFPI